MFRAPGQASWRHLVSTTALSLGANGCESENASRAETTPLPSLAAVATCTGDTSLVRGIPGSPGHWIADPIHPNGSSELARLMRTMRDDMEAVRKRVLDEQPTRIAFTHHRIRCAWPTAPDDRSAKFDAMAVAYLQAIDVFNAHNGTTEFNAVVQGCANCHADACTGALVAITPLRIP